MYQTVIGLEIHCQLNTRSKVFSTGLNNYDVSHNNNLTSVDLAMPGILPVLNKEAVKKAIKLSLALNCDIADYILFDRKNYFYPDLPKGYQITQSHLPFGQNGYLMINVNDEYDKKVLIHDIHLEEDTASIDHYSNYSLLDYNRAGMPLVEIVTEPCLNSPKEALSFLENLRKVLLYLDLSYAKVEKGQIRCDVNISLKKEDAKELGTKVEIKNINSFYGVKEALEYEITRQTEILNNHGQIIMETRRYDDATKTTISMREKTEAVDYKYFIEPNIPSMSITKAFISDIKNTLVELPYELVNKYMNEYHLSRKDANTLVKEYDNAKYFEQCLTYESDAKLVANWLNGEVLAYLNKEDKKITEIYLTPKMLADLIDLISSGQINSKQAKEILAITLRDHQEPKEVYQASGITQIDNQDELKEIVINIVNNNPIMVTKYQEGRNVLDFFIGQIMKETKGQANPKIVSDLFKVELAKKN